LSFLDRLPDLLLSFSELVGATSEAAPLSLLLTDELAVCSGA